MLFDYCLKTKSLQTDHTNLLFKFQKLPKAIFNGEEFEEESMIKYFLAFNSPLFYLCKEDMKLKRSSLIKSLKLTNDQLVTLAKSIESKLFTKEYFLSHDVHVQTICVNTLSSIIMLDSKLFNLYEPKFLKLMSNEIMRKAEHSLKELESRLFE